MKSRGHSVVAEVVHREVNRAFEVLVNRALFAVVREVNLLVEELLVAALADILVNGREQPKRVICAIRGVSRFTNIAFFVGRVLVTGVVGVLYKRKSRAVRDLRREHKLNLLLRHLGRKVNDTLNILNGVAVAKAVSQAAVNERSRS